MRIQNKVINPNRYDYFTVSGKPKTKEEKIADAIKRENYKKLHGGKERPEFTPTEEQIDQFNSWLQDFQPDIVKIVGKHRKAHHKLSNEEIISEINISLLKKRASLIEYIAKNGGFHQQNFKKSAFVYSRNLISWTHSYMMNTSYVKKREDNVYYDDEDGFKTSYDLAVESKDVNVESDPAKFYSFDKNNGIKNFVHVLQKYSDLFTTKEVEIMGYLAEGLTHIEIGEKMGGVSHQAIQQRIVVIKQKAQSRFDVRDIFNEDGSKISRGINSIQNVFAPNSDSFTKEDKQKLADFVMKHPHQYTLEEINKILFNDRFNYRQLCSSLVRRNLMILVKSNKLSNTQKEDIVRRLKKGQDATSISKKLNIPINSIRGLRSHLVVKGEIEPLT